MLLSLSTTIDNKLIKIKEKYDIRKMIRIIHEVYKCSETKVIEIAKLSLRISTPNFDVQIHPD